MKSTGVEDSCDKPSTTTSPNSTANKRKSNYKKSEEPKNASDNFASIEDLDEEKIVDSSFLETEFSQFLDVWIEISADKTEEVMDIEDENEEILSVNAAVHPAVDSNAKWDLITLFNELELP
ncbi:12265_t:CDS:2 [Cetraspora pellucida]|uniref:12265_t:CDS:1 n=1 Tax=Cetraspora pellucida TaxID=1433469 RepID=A0ACA9LUT0_9GLOM|nr:12265_t:CDS:2 [Cetraspora pellucida]